MDQMTGRRYSPRVSGPAVPLLGEVRRQNRGRGYRGQNHGSSVREKGPVCSVYQGGGWTQPGCREAVMLLKPRL